MCDVEGVHSDQSAESEPVIREGLENSPTFQSILLEFGKSSPTKKLYGRQNEKDRLLQCWKQCSEQSNLEVVVIFGSPGTGKSALANSLRPFVSRAKKPKAFFLSAKFNESHCQRSGPFEAFASAFTSYVNLFVDSGDETLIDLCRQKIMESLNGSERQALVNVIPAFEQLLGTLSNQSFCGANSSFQSQQIYGMELATRLRNTLSKTVAAICACSPLALFLDDMHLADSSSLDLLRHLIECDRKIPLLIITTAGSKPRQHCEISTSDIMDQWSEPRRSISSDSDSIVKKSSHSAHGRKHYSSTERRRHFLSFLKELEQEDGVHLTSIDLSDLGLEHIQLMLSDILKSDPANLVELSRIAHDRTQGNIFHLLQFLRLLAEQGIITEKGGKWVWDDENLDSRVGSTDSTLDLVMKSLRSLPRPVQEALKVASCLGDELDDSAIALVLQTATGVLLEQAADEGLLIFNPQFGGYRFAHDFIRHAAFCLIPDDEVKEFHLKLARRLRSNSSSTASEGNIVLIVSLLNFGAEAITDHRERIKAAELNLRAARRVLLVPSFPDASKYLHKGIELLGSNCWSENYQLALDIYSLCAEVETVNGNFDVVPMCINEVVKNGHTLDDKIQAYEALVSSMHAQEDFDQAASVCINVLQQLGEPMPRNASKLVVGAEFTRMRLALSGKSNEFIFKLPRMTDSRKITCMSFLSMGFDASFRSRSPMAGIFAFRAVRMSLRHGIHSTSGLAFAVYACVLCGFQVDSREGYRFGQLSLKISGLFNDPKICCFTSHIVGSLVIPWTRPLEESIATLDHGAKVGMETGYVGDCVKARFASNLIFHLSGRKLVATKKELKAGLKLCRLYRLRHSECFFAIFLQLIDCYDGTSQDPSHLSEFEMTLCEAKEANDHLRVAFLYCCSMETCVLHGDYEQAGIYAKGIEEVERLPSLAQLSARFLMALLVIDSYRRGGKPSREMRLARKFFLELTKCSKAAPSNFLCRKYLLEAEMLSIKKGSKEDAISSLYRNACDCAREQGNLMIMALACERLGDFFESKNVTFQAMAEWTKAADLYREWGALHKSRRLLEQCRSIRTCSTNRKYRESTTLHCSCNASSHLMLKPL